MPTSLWSPVLTPVAKQYQVSDGKRAWEEEKTKALGQRWLLSKLKMSENILCNYIQHAGSSTYRTTKSALCVHISIYLSNLSIHHLPIFFIIIYILPISHQSIYNLSIDLSSIYTILPMCIVAAMILIWFLYLLF